MVYIQRVIV